MDNWIEMEFGYLVNGIISCTCAGIGLSLNIFAIFILMSKKDLYNLFNRLLTCLLCFDNCLLVSWIFFRLYVDFNIKTDLFIWIFPYFTYPFVNIATTASTFMTVGLAHERYLCVRDPVKYNQLTSNPRTHSLRILMYILPVVTFSMFYNIPLFFCFEVEQLGNTTELQIVDTKLRQDPLFATYYINWTRLIISGILPFCLLIFYNLKLYQIVKRNSDRKRRDGNICSNRFKRAEEKERNMAIVLLGIVLLFLICHR